jgi:uncharacterized membrane protein YtjA (UPF0391 family)
MTYLNLGPAWWGAHCNGLAKFHSIHRKTTRSTLPTAVEHPQAELKPRPEVSLTNANEIAAVGNFAEPGSISNLASESVLRICFATWFLEFGSWNFFLASDVHELSLLAAFDRVGQIQRGHFANTFAMGGTDMLRLAVIFLIIALIAGALGLFHVEAVSSQVAWILFVIFLILFLVSLVFGGVRRPPPV